MVLLENFKLTSGNEFNITIALSIVLDHLDQALLQEAMNEYLNKDLLASRKSSNRMHITKTDNTSTIASSTRNENIILCKKAASNKWLLDYTMEHGKASFEQKIEAIKQISIFTDAIRKYCADSNVNFAIQQSAKKGIKPKWIEAEINALIEQL